MALREDLDGDGLVDWLFGDHDADANGPSSGAIYVISGMDPARADVHVLDVAEHYWAGAVERSHFGSQVREVATGPDMRALGGLYCEDYSGGDWYWWVAPIRALPGPAEPPPEGLRIQSSNEDLLRFEPSSNVDIDADGYDELLTSYCSPAGDGSSPLGTVVIPGWEIPWDAPEWW
ncbi:MAG: hypothetical protein Q8P41_01410 [Pseudomonadota bacterium]|nr:hypothetical protein [Pseudomonadota bacterium]